MREDVIGRANVEDTPELDRYYNELGQQESYALWTEPLPLVLLVLGLRRRGWLGFKADLSRFGVLAAVMVGCLVLLVILFVTGRLLFWIGSLNDARLAASGTAVTLNVVLGMLAYLLLQVTS